MISFEHTHYSLSIQNKRWKRWPNNDSWFLVQFIWFLANFQLFLCTFHFNLTILQLTYWTLEQCQLFHILMHWTLVFRLSRTHNTVILAYNLRLDHCKRGVLCWEEWESVESWHNASTQSQITQESIFVSFSDYFLNSMSKKEV